MPPALNPRLTLLMLATLLLSGCLTMEPAEISDGEIRNPSVGSFGYAIDVPRGYTAMPMPEYIPHIAFTQAWLESEEAMAYEGFVYTQALENKLRADHIIYRRPNYRAYFSTSGEDFIIVPDDQLEVAAPSPFLVFSTLNRGRGTEEMGLGDAAGNRIGRFGAQTADLLAAYATNVEVDTREILGREWTWITATLVTPIPPKGDVVDAIVEAKVETSDNVPPETWRFIFAATLGNSGECYAIQGWGRPEDFDTAVRAASDMVSSLGDLYGTGD